MIWTGHPEFETLFRQFFYPDGAKYQWFRVFAQCIWMGVLGLCAVGGLRGWIIPDRSKRQSVFDRLKGRFAGQKDTGVVQTGRMKESGIYPEKAGEHEFQRAVLKLTVVGMILFEMLFEPRARHLLVMVPILCILAAEAVDTVSTPVKPGSKGRIPAD